MRFQLAAQATDIDIDAYRDIETRSYWVIMSIYGIAAAASFYRAWVGVE